MVIDRKKYPYPFNPDHFGVLEPTNPQETFTRSSVLGSAYTVSELDIQDILTDYPTATHLSLEEEDGNITVEFVQKITSPNPNYADQKRRYDDAMIEFRKKKAEWERMRNEYLEEEKTKKRDAEYQNYLRLKAQFEK